jgi:hypothetical protein
MEESGVAPLHSWILVYLIAAAVVLMAVYGVGAERRARRYRREAQLRADLVSRHQELDQELDKGLAVLVSRRRSRQGRQHRVANSAAAHVRRRRDQDKLLRTSLQHLIQAVLVCQGLAPTAYGLPPIRSVSCPIDSTPFSAQNC